MTLSTPPKEVLRRYCPSTDNIRISPLGEGNINDTFLLQTASKSIVLQRINAQVFPNPQLIIDNLQQLSRHLVSRPKETGQRWEDTLLVPADDGAFSVKDNKENLWRALSYIQNSSSLLRVATSFQAEQTGWALAHFHRRLTGLDGSKMQPVLPGFHHTSNYLRHFDQLIPDKKKKNTSESRFCLGIISRERSGALSLEDGLQRGIIRQSIIHGDPKISNILFDRESGKAVSIVDLDTVGPGLIQHDIGDCLRSVCNTAGEDGNMGDVRFDLDTCRSTLKGYFQEGASLLTPVDRAYIYDGLKSITFELGLRFFTDYLQNNIYFKCSRPEETLEKALVQFNLLQDITSKEETIRRLSGEQ